MIFDETLGNEYQRHTRTWDELTSEMQDALKNHGLVDKTRTILVSGGH
jgi:hypothetical protein